MEVTGDPVTDLADLAAVALVKVQAVQTEPTLLPQVRTVTERRAAITRQELAAGRQVQMAQQAAAAVVVTITYAKAAPPLAARAAQE